MRLVDILRLGRGKVSQGTATQVAAASEPRFLEPLSATLHVGSVDAGSALLEQLVAPLHAIGSGKFIVTPNRPTKGNYEGKLIGVRVLDVNEVYDGRARYLDSGDVKFELSFGAEADPKIRRSVMGVVYPLLGKDIPSEE